jgi:hypothetical protein
VQFFETGGGRISTADFLSITPLPLAAQPHLVPNLRTRTIVNGTLEPRVSLRSSKERIMGMSFSWGRRRKSFGTPNRYLVRRPQAWAGSRRFEAVSVLVVVPHPEQGPRSRVSSGTTGCAGCARLLSIKDLPPWSGLRGVCRTAGAICMLLVVIESTGMGTTGRGAIWF